MLVRNNLACCRFVVRARSLGRSTYIVPGDVSSMHSNEHGLMVNSVHFVVHSVGVEDAKRRLRFKANGEGDVSSSNTVFPQHNDDEGAPSTDEDHGDGTHEDDSPSPQPLHGHEAAELWRKIRELEASS